MIDWKKTDENPKKSGTVEYMTGKDVQKLVDDLHGLMWQSQDGCKVCAHCIVTQREPYYRCACALEGECIPLWRGFKEDEDERT